MVADRTSEGIIEGIDGGVNESVGEGINGGLSEGLGGGIDSGFGEGGRQVKVEEEGQQ